MNSGGVNRYGPLEMPVGDLALNLPERITLCIHLTMPELERFGLIPFFNNVVFSSDLNACKPNPLIFQSYARPYLSRTALTSNMVMP
jgi:hypothetical protein